MPKKTLVYLHRYPIEFEAIQYQGLRELLDELNNEFNVIYFSMSNDKDKDNSLRKKAKIIELPLTVNNKSLFDKYFKTILYYFMLPITFFKLRKLNPDIIICKETLPFIPLTLCQLKKPIIVDISDWWLSILIGKSKIGRKLAELIEAFEVKRWTNHDIIAVVHTEAERKIVEKREFSKKKVIKMSVPLHKELYFPVNSERLRKKIGFQKKDFVAAVHGITHPSKGYEQIIGWWRMLVKEHPNWKLMMIGGLGLSGDKHKKLINELRLNKNIIMTGWLPTQNDVNRYLNAADCLLVTRRNNPENQGVVPSALFHSMATGKPTIATGLPGISEFIKDGINGYLFKPDNYNSFKSTLEKVESNEDKAKKVGLFGMKMSKKFFNPKKTAREYLLIIKKTLKK